MYFRIMPSLNMICILISISPFGALASGVDDVIVQRNESRQVTVKGIGSNYEDALLDAMRTAIGIVVGTNV